MRYSKTSRRNFIKSLPENARRQVEEQLKSQTKDIAPYYKRPPLSIQTRPDSLTLTIPYIVSTKLVKKPWYEYRNIRRKVSGYIQQAMLFEVQYNYWPWPPYERARLEVIRYSSGKQPDQTNLETSVKPIEDVLLVSSAKAPDGLGVLIDDNSEHLIRLPTHHRQCRRDEQRTTILIYRA